MYRKILLISNDRYLSKDFLTKIYLEKKKLETLESVGNNYCFVWSILLHVCRYLEHNTEYNIQYMSRYSKATKGEL